MGVTPHGGAPTRPRATPQVVIFHDGFDKLDVTMWKHEITLSGGGNWE